MSLVHYLCLFRQSVPSFSSSTYKGQAGRIIVVGGSMEYTGAPYFSAMACMKAGAELATICCHEAAAIPIKCYSPDLIVLPGLSCVSDKVLQRMHAVVLGPGLGRDMLLVETAEKVVNFCIEHRVPLVIDADALWFLAKSESLRSTIQNAPEGVVIYATPNVIEMQRLVDALRLSEVSDVVHWFRGRLVIVQKGARDCVFTATKTCFVDTEGSLKRAGGQGDVLSGLIALFAHWTESLAKRSNVANADDKNEAVTHDEYKISAAVAACVITRTAARHAFHEKGRAMIASDVLDAVGDSFVEVFEGSSETQDINTT